MAARTLGLILALLALAGGCVQDDGKSFNPIRSEVDPSDEREIGWNFDREIQQHLEMIYDPVVLGVDKFSEYGMVIVTYMQTRPDTVFQTRRELLRRIKKRFDEEGIEISVPNIRLLYGEDAGTTSLEPAK